MSKTWMENRFIWRAIINVQHTFFLFLSVKVRYLSSVLQMFPCQFQHFFSHATSTPSCIFWLYTFFTSPFFVVLVSSNYFLWTLSYLTSMIDKHIVPALLSWLIKKRTIPSFSSFFFLIKRKFFNKKKGKKKRVVKIRSVSVTKKLPIWKEIYVHSNLVIHSGITLE